MAELTQNGNNAREIVASVISPKEPKSLNDLQLPPT
jgi:hypothetical protein